MSTTNIFYFLFFFKKMSDWIKLNVGGQKFYTTRTTLMSEPDSMIARMFSEENKF